MACEKCKYLVSEDNRHYCRLFSNILLINKIPLKKYDSGVLKPLQNCIDYKNFKIYNKLKNL